MKNLSIVKHAEVLAPNDEYHNNLGIVAFQLIDVCFRVYGTDRQSRYDTKIMKDGRQLIIDGDGWLKDNTDINQLLVS